MHVLFYHNVYTVQIDLQRHRKLPEAFREGNKEKQTTMASWKAAISQWTRSLLKRLFPDSRNALPVERSPYGLPIPRVKHRTVTEEEINNRELVILGDIHGCYDELCLLLQKCNGRDPNKLILCVGDLVNKGPGNLQVVRLLHQLGALTVRGNHDEVCLGEWLKSQDTERERTLPGKYRWMNHLTSEELEWLSELPYTISIPSRNIVIVHAGLVPEVAIQDQSPDHMLHIRDVRYDVESSQWRPCKQAIPDSKPWASQWPGPSHVYFGHDARRLYQSYNFATGLDTACVYGRKLTAVYPCDNGRLVEVEAIGVPRDRPELDPTVQ